MSVFCPSVPLPAASPLLTPHLPHLPCPPCLPSVSQVTLHTDSISSVTSSSSGISSSLGSALRTINWTPPHSVGGSTPTHTEGTPSMTESSDSGDLGE